MRRLVCALLVWVGCDTNSPTYFAPDGGIELGLAGPDGGAPVTTATGTVSLVFRAPDEMERRALAEERTRLGFETPWLRRDEIAIEVLYSLVNLEDRAGTARIEVNGASEFVEYDPEAVRALISAMNPGNDEETVVLPLIQGVPVEVGPRQTVQGVVREDDFTEAELDLDAMGRFMGNSTALLINRSEVSRIGLEMVPPGEIVPALFRVAVTCSATVRMRCDFLVRVRDPKERLWDGTGPRFEPMPTAFTPPAMGM